MRSQHTKSKERESKLLVGVVVAAVWCAPLFWSVTAETAELQEPGPRQGYYIGLGVRGNLDGLVTEEKDWYGPWPGVIGELRFGESLTSFFDLGLSLGSGVALDKSYLATLGYLSIDAQFRPKEFLFLRGSIGFGFVDVSRRQTEKARIDGSIGAYYRVAVGYDFFPLYKKGSGGFAVTPIAGMEAWQSELISVLSGFVGIEIAWWTGLRKDKLVSD